jgi:DNA-binding response OmpR family regulator
MKSIICFIDDSDYEHDLVRNEIAPQASEMAFLQAYTFEAAQQQLGEKTPSLFLLDLWGQDASVAKPYLTTKRELENRVAQFPSLNEVYEGLDRLEGDVNNVYLKRLFRIVDSWRGLFEEVCGRIGQNRKYGLSNLADVRRIYPGVPAVFYTRKSLISDAVAMFNAGADDLFIKPTGPDDAKTRQLTREYAPRLIKNLQRTIDSHAKSIGENMR